MPISRGNIGRHFEVRTRDLIPGALDTSAWCYDLTAPGEIIEVKATYRERFRLDAFQMQSAVEAAEERAVTYALWHYGYKYRDDGPIAEKCRTLGALTRMLNDRTECVWFLPVELIFDLVSLDPPVVEAREEGGRWGRNFLLPVRMLHAMRRWKGFCRTTGMPDVIASAWKPVYRRRKGVHHPIVVFKPTPRT